MISEINATDPADDHDTQRLKTALHIKQCGVLCRVQGASTNVDVGSPEQ